MGLLTVEQVTKIKPQLAERLTKVRMVFTDLAKHVHTQQNEIEELKTKMKVCIETHKPKKMNNNMAKFYAQQVVRRAGVVNRTIKIMDHLDSQIVILNHLMALAVIYQLQKSDLPSIQSVASHTDTIIEIIKTQNEMMEESAAELIGAGTVEFEENEDKKEETEPSVATDEESADVPSEEPIVYTQENVDDKSN